MAHHSVGQHWRMQTSPNEFTALFQPNQVEFMFRLGSSFSHIASCSVNHLGKFSVDGSETRSVSNSSTYCSCDDLGCVWPNPCSTRIDAIFQCCSLRRQATTIDVCDTPVAHINSTGCCVESNMISSASLTNSSETGFQDLSAFGDVVLPSRIN